MCRRCRGCILEPVGGKKVMLVGQTIEKSEHTEPVNLVFYTCKETILLSPDVFLSSYD